MNSRHLTRTIAALAAPLLWMTTAAQPAHAGVLLSTDFSTTTSDNVVHFDGTTTNTGAGIGTITNWSVADASKVDVVEVTTFTVGSNTFGSGSDTVKRGEWVTMLDGGAYTTGGASPITANRRINNTINLQFNASAVGNSSATAPASVGIFAFVFEVKAGESYDHLSATFDMGTGNTSGGWYSATAAQNGSYNVRILGVDNATDFSFYNSPQAAGPTTGSNPVVPYTATAAAPTGTALDPGIYLLQVQMSNKTQNQRYTIDNFSFSAEVVPEPATLAVAAAGALLLLPRRRARL